MSLCDQFGVTPWASCHELERETYVLIVDGARPSKDKPTIKLTMWLRDQGRARLTSYFSEILLIVLSIFLTPSQVPDAQAQFMRCDI